MESAHAPSHLHPHASAAGSRPLEGHLPFKKSVQRPHTVVLLLILILATVPLAGEERGAVTASNPSPTRARILTLETLTVADGAAVAPERLLEFTPSGNLPTGPRPLTIDDSRLEEYGVNDLRELTQQLPGVSAPARFGNLTLPTIRGDAADLYVNGQRLLPNLFGWRPVFNGVATAAVGHGPAPLSSTPGTHTGGYLNLITVTPRKGLNGGSLMVEIGDWAPGEGSYGRGRWRIQKYQEIHDSVTAFLSYEGQENETFYRGRGVREDYHDFIASLRFDPIAGGTLDLIAQYQLQDVPQILGVNRPSRELVEQGIYYTGTVDESDETPLFGKVLTEAEATALPREAILNSPGDSSDAERWFGQAIFRRELDSPPAAANRNLVVRAMAEHVDRDRQHAVFYAEDFQGEAVELQILISESGRSLGSGRWIADTRMGLTGRHEGKEGVVNYLNEFFFAFDLARDEGAFKALERFPLSVIPGRPGPKGRPFFGAAEGIPESTDSDIAFVSVLAEQNLTWNRTLTLSWAARAEHISAEARDAFPLPGNKPLGDEADASHLDLDLGVSWQIDPDHSVYVAFRRVHSVNGSTVGSTLRLYPEDRDGNSVTDGLFIDADDLRNRSTLFEAGLDGAIADGSLTYRLTAYHQERRRSEIQGGNLDLRARGAEFELNGRISEQLSLFGGLSYSDAEFQDAAPFELGGPNPLDIYPEGEGPGGQGTGVGYLPFGLSANPVGDHRVPGLARWQAVGGVSATVVPDWTVRLWGWWNGEAPGNIQRSFTIPDQFELNTSVSWAVAGWTLTLELFNLTDEDNWVHNGDPFMDNQLIGRSLPRRVRLRALYSF